MRISTPATAALFICIAAGSGAALAQMAIPPGMQGQTGLRQACRADYGRLCNEVQPGGGRIVACLQSHSGELTSGCRDALSKAGGRSQ